MKVFLSVAIIGLVITLSGSWIIASRLTEPTPSVIDKLPLDMNITEVTFDDVSGWFIGSSSNQKCVLLMHAIRSNRLSMINRANFLLEEGYSLLLIDLQAHGESAGDRITFGLRESVSAHRAVDYLKAKQNCHEIVSLGTSLGGAASLLGTKPLEVDAYIVEAVYSSIEQAVYNRVAMQLGDIAATVLAPILYLQIPLRLDIPLDSLQPKEAIKNINAPVLIIAGAKDKHTRLRESKQLYNNAPHPKQMWIIDDAAHVDFYNFSQEKYEHVVLDFLGKHLASQITEDNHSRLRKNSKVISST